MSLLRRARLVALCAIALAALVVPLGPGAICVRGAAPTDEIAAFAVNVAELQAALDTEFDQEALTKAGEKAQEIVRTERLRPMPSQARIATALDWCALLYAHLGDAASAKSAAAEQVALARAQLGDDSWQAASARERERYVDAVLKLSAEQRKLVHNLYGSISKARELKENGDAADALAMAKAAQATWRALLGEDHLAVAAAARDAGEYAVAAGKIEQGNKLLSESAATLSRLVGKEHPETLIARRQQAVVVAAKHRYAEAETLLREVLAAEQKVHGENDPSTAACYEALGLMYSSRGMFAAAEAPLAKAVEIRTKVLGQDDLKTLESLEHQAANYQSLGQVANAERTLLILQASVRKKFGDQSLGAAFVLRALGTLYNSMEDFDRSERFFTQSLNIILRLERPAGIQTAAGMWMLGENELVQGRYQAADQRLTDALALARRSLPKGDPTVTSMEIYQALSRQCLGRFEEAAVIYDRSRQSVVASLGPDHPSLAVYDALRGVLEFQRGHHEEARQFFLHSLQVVEQSAVESSAAGEGAELQFAGIEGFAAQRVATNRSWLDLFVQLAVANDFYAASAYEHVVKSKGSTLARQRQLRAVADAPHLAEIWRQREKTAAELALVVRQAPTPQEGAKLQQRLESLMNQLQGLEVELARSSAAYRAAAAPPSREQLAAALPPDSVLVDFWEYGHYDLPTPEKQVPLKAYPRLAAFIVRTGQPVKVVGLGPMAPISQAIDAWRRDYGAKSPSGIAAGQELVAKVWRPVEEHLAGAKLVLVSPDGDLARLPLAALPGKSPGSYLLEDWAIALIPSAQAIPTLLAEEPPPQRIDSNVLLVGGVDYDGGSAEEQVRQKPKFKDFQTLAARASERLTFDPLPGARDEAAVIAKEYEDLIDMQKRGLTVLEGKAANEDAIRRLAPRHVYLHFATHGFFAPPEIKSALDRPANSTSQLLGDVVTKQSISGFHPGLLSGLAFAGANRPVAEGDDGILTAQEVSTLDLRGVKLVVLSACETGLGEVAGGEGLLGLQRAFQAAGARTVMASLWKVDDLVTRDLMKRFYDNLWNKGMSKVEALREAQLWLLRERGPRGLVQVDEGTQKTNRLPPFYGAAFTLSGDWR